MKSKQLFYKIGDVCAELQVEPHVVRYWEDEFPQLAPKKNKAGQRIYSQRDMELLRKIQHLLYARKFKIAGARQVLLDGGGVFEAADSTPPPQPQAAPAGAGTPAELPEALLKLKAQLLALKAQLSQPIKQ